MNKNKIKIFAVNAREEIIKKIKQKSNFYKIKDDKSAENELGNTDINGKMLSDKEIKLRNELVEKIKKDGYENTVEEIAYTWFNRLMAIKYMDKNKFFPSFIPKYITIFELEDNNELKILRDPLEIAEELELNQKEIINDYQSNQKAEIFKKIIIKICNEMNKYIPVMFEKIEDYTELLFPETIITDIIPKMISEIDETDWEEIEIIGWMYQFYIESENKRVIQAKQKYSTSEIPFATQLFTPKWIVKYITENSLGKYLIEHIKKLENLKDDLEFYINDNENNKVISDINIEEIKIIDPACGSGHILIYAFEILYNGYKLLGYQESEISEKIINKNLFGLDVDKRAVQLASFSILMKACSKNSRFLNKLIKEDIKINILEFQETKFIEKEIILKYLDNEIEKNLVCDILELFFYAKDIGSIIKIKNIDYTQYKEIILKLKNKEFSIFDKVKMIKYIHLLENLVEIIKIIENKYDVFITNPPYMNSKYMNETLLKYVQNEYKDYKIDLVSCFMKRSFEITLKTGVIGMVTPYVWMFIQSYENLRKEIVENKTITTLTQLEYNAFEAACVPVCTFVLQNSKTINDEGIYIKLSEFRGVDNQPIKTLEAIKNKETKYRFTAKSGDFEKIPGSPIAYWVSEKVKNIFTNKIIGELLPVKKGIDTGNNKLYIRSWNEINFNFIDFNKIKEEISTKYWIPYNDGGDFRKWYGNNNNLIFWKNNGEKLKNSKANLRSKHLYFQKSLTWNALSSYKFSIRFSSYNTIFDSAGSSMFPNKDEKNYLGLCNTNLINYLLNLLNPTLNYGAGTVSKIPIIFPKEESIKNKIDEIVQENIDISKTDWDNFETSWDFEVHPLIKYRNSEITIEKSFENWKNFAEDNFNKLWKNEEELNKIFLEIYDLSDEMSPEVEEKDVTVRKADLERDIKSFISYGVGCIMGRYSPDKPGLIFAGGEFDFESYSEFKPDKDGIIPITENNYFEDDLTNRFVELVKYIYGKESLEENLGFIAKILNEKYEDSRETIRNYFYKEFYKDHCRIYQKKPIYWMFNSGKNGAFKAIVYLHRYNRETIGTLRNEYLLELQSMYNFNGEEMEKQIKEDKNLDKKDIKKMQKDIVKLNDYIEEIRKYDEKVHHYADLKIELDLDDGVSVNYKKFMKNDEELLEKI